MKESKFNIKDESQDRKYFSIVPNYIINHSTLAERGFYLTLKRIAGEEGSVYYSARELGELCGIKKSKVYQLINKLLERGWIRKTGSIKAKTKPRTTYGVVDLWQKNISFYENKRNVHSDGKSKIIQKGGQTSSVLTDTKEEQGKENLNNTSETLPKSKSRQSKSNKTKNYRCPLLLPEKYPRLVKKYPNGHAECVEFISAVEKEKGHKFINMPKQIGIVHRILRAGFDFTDMNRALDAIQENSFYQEKGWDFATVAQWLERK